MSKAKRHRSAELERLRADPSAALRLETDEGPNAPGQRFAPRSNPESAELFRDRWRKLISPPAVMTPGQELLGSHSPSSASGSLSSYAGRTPALAPAPGGFSRGSPFSQSGVDSGAALQYHNISSGFGQVPDSITSTLASSRGGSEAAMPFSSPTPAAFTPGQQQMYPFVPTSMVTEQNHLEQSQSFGHLLPPPGLEAQSQFDGHSPWLWADADPSVDVFGDTNVSPNAGPGGLGDLDVDMDTEMNWQDWFESVKGLEGDLGALPGGKEGW